MSSSRPEWMLEALELAVKAAERDEVPVGAVVICEDEVIGRGFNLRECDGNPVAHAEMLAIQDAARQKESWRLTDCTLVVTLEPCLMCLAASQQARVTRVIYGARDPKGGAISLGYRFNEDLRLNHRFEVVYVENPECGRILSEFFRKKRKGTK